MAMYRHTARVIARQMPIVCTSCEIKNVIVIYFENDRRFSSEMEGKKIVSDIFVVFLKVE